MSARSMAEWVAFDGCTSSIPRPSVSMECYNANNCWVAFSFGPKYSDPIVNVQVELGGTWLGRLLDRWLPR